MMLIDRMQNGLQDVFINFILPSCVVEIPATEKKDTYTNKLCKIENAMKQCKQKVINVISSTIMYL